MFLEDATIPGPTRMRHTVSFDCSMRSGLIRYERNSREGYLSLVQGYHDCLRWLHILAQVPYLLSVAQACQGGLI